MPYGIYTAMSLGAVATRGGGGGFVFFVAILGC